MTLGPPTGPHERDDRWLSFGKELPPADREGNDTSPPPSRRATDPRDLTDHRD